MPTEFEIVVLDCCPFCGVPAWAGHTSCVRTFYGIEFDCRLCSAYVWQGRVISPGSHLDPDEVAKAVREAFPGVAASEPAYIAPEHRRIEVRFELAVPPRAPESGQ